MTTKYTITTTPTFVDTTQYTFTTTNPNTFTNINPTMITNIGSPTIRGTYTTWGNSYTYDLKSIIENNQFVISSLEDYYIIQNKLKESLRHLLAKETKTGNTLYGK